MARKIIRAADRDKAREESKKAAEAVPVKDSWDDTDAHVDMSKCNHASAVLNKMSRVFKCQCGAEFTEKFALMNGLSCSWKGKSGKIQSVSDLDHLPFSAIEDAMVKGNGIDPGWYPYPKPQPTDFTLDDMLKFVGAPSPGEEIKYRTDGVILGGYLYATDLKCSVRIRDYAAIELFGLHEHDNGDVTKGKTGSPLIVGYVSGKAGCNGTDLETPPMHKMPWAAIDGSTCPVSQFNILPITRQIKCPVCNGGFVKKCPACGGLGCKSCNNNGGERCKTCVDGTVVFIPGYRFVPLGGNKFHEFSLSFEYHNKILSLPDVGFYESKIKGVIGFDFRVNKNHRGQGICITMNEPKVTGEFTVQKKTQSKADVAKELGVDPSKTMLSGSGGGVGKTNTNAAEFAKMVKMLPATHDGFSGPSTIMGMGDGTKNS